MRTRNNNRSNPTAIGAALRTLGGLGGGVLGGYFGNAALGSTAGTGLGAMVSKFLGQGDYTVRSNSLVNKVRTSGDIPSMHSSGQSIIVRHREYIADVTSSTGFVVSGVYPLNPGLSTSFPWLSTVAQQYQEYTWKGVIYEFISTSGDAVSSTNNALGTVMMATDYKATQPAFGNKIQLLNQFFSTDGKPSESFCHPIECDPKENPYNVQYVRGGAVPVGEDQKTYDLGVAYLATQGMQAAAIDVGELWVSYEVELRKPIPTGLSNLFGSDAAYSTTTTSVANVFGATRNARYDRIGLTVTGSTVSWPVGTQGTFMFIVHIGLDLSVNWNNWCDNATKVNCITQLYGSGNGQYVNTTTGVGSIAMVMVTIVNPILLASFTPVPTSFSGTGNGNLWVIEVGPNDN